MTSRGKSECKGPVAGVSLTGLSSSSKANMARAE